METSTFFSSFTFVDTLSHPRNIKGKFDKDVIMVHNKPSCKRVMIGSEYGRELIEAGFTSARLAYSNLTGGYAMVFQQEQSGHMFRYKNKGATTITINSDGLVSALARAFNIPEGESAALRLGPDQSKRPEVIFRMLDKVEQ